jgi:hypothetical protein
LGVHLVDVHYCEDIDTDAGSDGDANGDGVDTNENGEDRIDGVTTGSTIDEPNMTSRDNDGTTGSNSDSHSEDGEFGFFKSHTSELKQQQQQRRRRSRKPPEILR